jgi:hypothetical protein
MFAQLLDMTHIGVSRESLAGNQPNRFGNVVSVWSGTNIGWADKPSPLITVPIADNAPDGDMVIDLSDKTSAKPPYMVAYGASNSGTAYCAAQVAGASPPQEPIKTELGLTWLGSDSLLANFTTLPQNAPRTNRNWIGLWKGDCLTYDATNRIAKVDIERDDATSQSMNGLQLTVDTIYTLGYACGPRDEDLAAWVTFRTQPYLLRLLQSLFPIFHPKT